MTEDLLDKYLLLQTEVEGFMDRLGDELDEPCEETLDNIKELYELYSKLFNSNYYNLD